MRNLKHTYKTIKDNNKKTSTGRGRIGWEWYNDMENIFREDRTINIGPTLASMISSEETNSGKQSVMSSHSSTAACRGEQFIIASNYSNTDTQTEEDIIDDGASAWCVRTNNLNYFTNTCLDSVNFYVSNWLENCAKFKYSSYMYKMENKGTWYNQSINNHVINKCELFGCYSQTVRSYPTTDSSPDNISNNLCNRKNRKQKNTRAKALYDLRKKQLDCEERRIDAINELKEAINEHNNIQKERNNILRQLIQANRTT